jgi:hypothetical protein
MVETSAAWSLDIVKGDTDFLVQRTQLLGLETSCEARQRWQPF